VFPGYTVGGCEKSQLCSVLALKDAGFSFADVQSDAFLPSCMRTIAFSIANCFDVL